MIWSTDVSYTHQKDRNHYNAFYHGDQIGTVRYTPESAGTWTFTSSQGETETFGSTRFEAVKRFLEHFEGK